MTFIVNSIALCPGKEHITANVTVNGNAKVFQLTQGDLKVDIEAEELAIVRLRSAVKEAGATTPAQISAAILGKTFKV